MARQLNIDIADPVDVFGARPGERLLTIWLSEEHAAGLEPRVDRNVGRLIVSDTLLVDARQLTAALAASLGEIEVVWRQAGAALEPVPVDRNLVRAIRLLRRLFA